MKVKMNYSDWDEEETLIEKRERQEEAEYIRNTRGDDEHDKMIDEELLNEEE